MSSAGEYGAVKMKYVDVPEEKVPPKFIYKNDLLRLMFQRKSSVDPEETEDLDDFERNPMSA